MRTPLLIVASLLAVAVPDLCPAADGAAGGNPLLRPGGLGIEPAPAGLATDATPATSVTPVLPAPAGTCFGWPRIDHFRCLSGEEIGPWRVLASAAPAGPAFAPAGLPPVRAHAGRGFRPSPLSPGPAGLPRSFRASAVAVIAAGVPRPFAASAVSPTAARVGRSFRSTLIAVTGAGLARPPVVTSMTPSAAEAGRAFSAGPVSVTGAGVARPSSPASIARAAPGLGRAFRVTPLAPAGAAVDRPFAASSMAPSPAEAGRGFTSAPVSVSVAGALSPAAFAPGRVAVRGARAPQGLLVHSVAPRSTRLGGPASPDLSAVCGGADYARRLLGLARSGDWAGLAEHVRLAGGDPAAVAEPLRTGTAAPPDLKGNWGGVLVPSAKARVLESRLQRVESLGFKRPVLRVSRLTGEWRRRFDLTFAKAADRLDKPVLALCIRDMAAEEILRLPGLLRRHEGRYHSVIANYDLTNGELRPRLGLFRAAAQRVALVLALARRAAPAARLWLAVGFSRNPPWRDWVRFQDRRHYDGLALTGASATYAATHGPTAARLHNRLAKEFAPTPVGFVGFAHPLLGRVRGKHDRIAHLLKTSAAILRESGFSFVHVQETRR